MWDLFRKIFTKCFLIKIIISCDKVCQVISWVMLFISLLLIELWAVTLCIWNMLASGSLKNMLWVIIWIAIDVVIFMRGHASFFWIYFVNGMFLVEDYGFMVLSICAILMLYFTSVFILINHSFINFCVHLNYNCCVPFIQIIAFTPSYLICVYILTFLLPKYAVFLLYK